MNKFTLLFTLFSSTASFALPGYYELEPLSTPHVKRALHERANLNDFHQLFHQNTIDEKAPNLEAIDWLIMEYLQNPKNDTPEAKEKRRSLFSLLSENRFFQTEPKHFDEEKQAFDYNPRHVLAAIAEKQPIEEIHFMSIKEESASSSSADSRNAVHLHTDSLYKPDVLLSNPLDRRWLPALNPRDIAANVKRVVVNAHSNQMQGHTIESVLFDDAWMGWIQHTLMTLGADNLGVLELRGQKRSNDLDLRMLGYQFIPYGEDSEGAIQYIKLPNGYAEEKDLPASFVPEDYAAANKDTSTPLKEQQLFKSHEALSSHGSTLTSVSSTPAAAMSPSKQGGFRREMRQLAEQEAREARKFIKKLDSHATAKFLERYNTKGEIGPWLEGMPRGLYPWEYANLPVNRAVLKRIIEEVGLAPSIDSYSEFDEWSKSVVQWKFTFCEKAQDIFIASFDSESDYSAFKGKPFLASSPEDFNWLKTLQLNPQLLVEILSSSYGEDIELIDDETRPTAATAHRFVANLDEVLDRSNQMKLAMALNKWIAKSIQKFGEGQQDFKFYPWKPTPPGLDLNVFAQQEQITPLADNSHNLFRGRFMHDRDYTPDDMRNPLIQMEYLGWLQDMIQKYSTHGDTGYSYLPYMPPGVFTSSFERSMAPAFNAATNEWKDSAEAQDSEDVPGFLGFPIVRDFPELRPFLGFGDRAVWRFNPALTGEGTLDMGQPKAISQEVAKNRRLFHVWSQLYILNSLYTGLDEADCWFHASGMDAPEGHVLTLGWKSLLHKHPQLSRAFDVWWEKQGILPPSRFGQVTEESTSLLGMARGATPTSSPHGSPVPSPRKLGKMPSESDDRGASASAAAGDEPLNRLIRNGYLAAWAQQTWLDGISSGQFGLSMNPDVADGFDAISFIKLHEGSDGFPQELVERMTALQRGQLRGSDAIAAAYELMAGAEHFWLSQQAAGMELPWVTHYLPRGHSYNDWMETPEDSRAKMKKAVYPRGVNLITLKGSLSEVVAPSSRQDCRPWEVRAQEHVAQKPTQGFAYITNMSFDVDWNVLVDTYPTILNRAVFDRTRQPSLDYGSWVQEQYLAAGDTHESRMEKLAADEQQAAAQKLQQDRQEQQDRLARQRQRQEEQRRLEAQVQDRQQVSETAPLLRSTTAQDTDQGDDKKCCILQ